MESTPLPHSQSMPQLQNIEDPADLKKIFSTYLQTLPACERLKMTMTLIDNTRGQAIHTLKTMWALCEVAKEEKVWSPKFDSFDQFKSTLPFGHVIDLMLEQYEFLTKPRKANARTIIERWQCLPPEFLPANMMPGDGKLSDKTLKLLARLARVVDLDRQRAWMMIEETMQQRLLESNGASASSRQLKRKNGSNYVRNLMPADIEAIVRKLEAMSASSSSYTSSSSTSAGKAAIESASRITFVDPDSEDHPESPPLKRKRRGKNLPSKAYHGASSGRTRTSVVVPVTQTPRESSPSDSCHCASNVRRIWPLDKETSVKIPSLAETVRDTMRADLVVLCDFHLERYHECLVLGIQQQQRRGVGDTGSLNRAMNSCANENPALKDSGAGIRKYTKPVGTALTYPIHRRQSPS